MWVCLEAPPNKLQSLKVMVGSGTVICEKRLGVVFQYASVERICKAIAFERHILEHENEEIDSDVKYLYTLRVVERITLQLLRNTLGFVHLLHLRYLFDLRRHIDGSPDDVIQRNTDPGGVGEVDEQASAKFTDEHIVGLQVHVQHAGETSQLYD